MYEEGPSSASTREDCSTTFADYFATLQQVCEAGQPGVLQWTPDKNTPDTVYYQVCGGGGGRGSVGRQIYIFWCGVYVYRLSYANIQHRKTNKAAFS